MGAMKREFMKLQEDNRTGQDYYIVRSYLLQELSNTIEALLEVGEGRCTIMATIQEKWK